MNRSVDGITRRVIVAEPPASPTVRTVLKFSSRKLARALRYPLLVGTLVLIVLPFLPTLQFQVHILGLKAGTAAVDASSAMHTDGHWLVIPEIGLDTPILEGSSEDTVDRGVWRKPDSTVPGQKGNTVLLGHRYAYTEKANTFYFLDKVNVGDSFHIDWDGRQLTYRVIETKTVEADDLSIEASTTQPMITMYTCTPLLTGSKRLVVRAIPVS